MFDKKRSKEEIIAKFNQYLKARGGIFTRKTRGRLLGIPNLPGRKKTTKYDFWHDRRNDVKMALIDLQIFTEVAGKKNFDEVISKETLSPLIKDILSFYGGPNQNKADIARLFIQEGFNYLQRMKPENITLAHRRTIEEALDLSNYLVEVFEGEGKYHPKPYS